MNNKKISASTLVILLVVSIIVGGGLGYYLTQNIAIKRALASKSGDNLREQSLLTKADGENAVPGSSALHKSTGDNAIETTTATNVMEYEQCESITIGGKEIYNIGTKTNKDADGVTRTGVYLNNTKLKSFSEGSYIMDVKTIKCDEEYIVIVVDSVPEYDGGAYVLIANQRQELLGAFGVEDVNQSYKYGDLTNYEIKEDKVVFISVLRDVKIKDDTQWLYGIYEVTANDSFLNFRLTRICTDDIESFGSKA